MVRGREVADIPLEANTMIASLIKMTGITVVSIIAGAVYIETQHPELEWAPSEEQLAVESKTRQQLDEVNRAQREREAAGEAAPFHITLEALLDHAARGDLVVDARERDAFARGHLDAPNILNAPPYERDAFIEQLWELMQMQMPVAIYCRSPTCDDAEVMRTALIEIFPEADALVTVFPGGWEALSAPDSNAPLTSGAGLPADVVISNVVSGGWWFDEGAE